MTLGREVTFTGTPRLLERVMPGLWGVTPCPGGLRVTGRLTGGVYRLPGGDTSQLISGMLMALPLRRESSRLEAPESVSRPYVDLTAWVLERYGVVLYRAQGGWRIPGGQCFAPLPMEQEGDWSAAAYWLVLAALGQSITVTGLRQDSRQGDRRALTLCRELPQQVSLRENPDLLPPLALLAALRPDKEMRFTDAARLRHKESDRLAATAALLTALGGRAQETADGLAVRGVACLQGGEVQSAGDHRLAMLAACAAPFCREPVVLRGADCTAKSYPAFWRDYARLGGKVEHLT